jgi:Arc/MetJ-type ribon-helix-helix transcriptional regulator
MARAKVAISLDESTLDRLDKLVRKQVFPNRSQAIEEAVVEKLSRIEKRRLAQECAKLDPAFEKALAEEGLSEELKEWPRMLRGEIRWADLNPVRGANKQGKDRS